MATPKRWKISLGMLIWLSWSFVYSQSIEQWEESMRDQPPSLAKVKDYIQFADTLLWTGDAHPYDPATYLDEAITLCNEINCGEWLYLAQALKALLDVQFGHRSWVDTFASPALFHERFTDPNLNALLAESCLYLYFMEGQLDSVKYFLDIEEQAVLQTPSSKRNRSFNEWAGFYYSFRNHHDTSITLMTKAAQLHLAAKDTLAFIKATKFLSSFHQLKGNESIAIEELIKAKNYIKQFPLADYLEVRILSGIGNGYYKLDQFERAIATYKEGLKKVRAEKEKDVVSEWDFLTGIAQSHVKLKNFEKGQQYLQEAYKCFEGETLGNVHRIATQLIEVDVLFGHQQLERVGVLIERIVENNGHGNLNNAYIAKIAQSLNRLFMEANIAPSAGFSQRLLPLLQKIISDADTTFSPEVLNAHKLLTTIHLIENKTDKALQHFKHTLAIQDTLWNRHKTSTANELLIAYETAAKEKQLAEQGFHLKKRTWQRNFLILASGLFLLIIGAIAFFYNQKKKYATKLEVEVHNRTEELQRMYEELAHFNNVASHDLKEPLRNIMGFSGLIKKQLPENTKFRTYHAHIERNVFSHA